MTFLLLMLLAAPAGPPAEQLTSAQAVATAQDETAASGDEAPQDDAAAPAEPSNKPPTPPHTGIRATLDGLRLDIRHLAAWPNYYIAFAGGAAALAVHPADPSVNRHLVSHYDTVNAIFGPGKYLGNTPEQLALSIGTYAYGRFFDEPKVSHLGMDLLRAQAITAILVEPLKYATQRTRPDGSDNLSFPSGHSAITFAGATVLERHLGWKKSALAYALATYVAASRMHDNVHYLSDVVFGAAVGTIAGRTVTEHGRETWTFVPAPVPGGSALVMTREWR